MCPIYKKKDKARIENYRPITVLNADYKIMTKTLASRLAIPALSIIHEDQAGFMNGRRIEDQTDLIKLMINWSEVEEMNGALVFLDQEKAYDKIMHVFLWESMRAVNIPENFIGIVRKLYLDAETVVMINGMKSEPFQVTRGVRQGDPLSCLLFNIATSGLWAVASRGNDPRPVHGGFAYSRRSSR